MWFTHPYYRFGIVPSAAQPGLRGFWGFWVGGFKAPSSSPPTAQGGNWLVLARRRFRR